LGIDGMSTTRKTFGWGLLVVAVLAALFLALASVQRMQVRPRTEDAYLVANIVHMAPDVSGRITSLRVRDNQSVKRGDVLFVIDPEPFVYRRDQAKAQLDSLRAQIRVDTTQVASQGSQANAADQAVNSAQTALDLARRTVSRLIPLAQRGFVTTQALDQARSTEMTAQSSLTSAVQNAAAAHQAIKSTAPIQADIRAAEAQLALAERDLRLTTVVAPCDGRVTALGIAAGEWASAGSPVFTIIDTEHWWAVGNFRETQLHEFQPGQSATVYVMQDSHHPVAGVIDSLNFGVVPDEGTVSNGLPEVPRSLNWVRIAQRYPVRILLQNPPPDLMRLGATAVIIVNR